MLSAIIISVFLFFCVTAIKKFPKQNQFSCTTVLKEGFPGGCLIHLEVKTSHKKTYSRGTLNPIRSEKSQTKQIKPHNEADSAFESFYPVLPKFQAQETRSKCTHY